MKAIFKKAICDGGGVQLTKQFITGSRNYTVSELILTMDEGFLP